MRSPLFAGAAPATGWSGASLLPERLEMSPHWEDIVGLSGSTVKRSTVKRTILQCGTVQFSTVQCTTFSAVQCSRLGWEDERAPPSSPSLAPFPRVSRHYRTLHTALHQLLHTALHTALYCTLHTVLHTTLHTSLHTTLHTSIVNTVAWSAYTRGEGNVSRLRDTCLHVAPIEGIL